MERRPASSGCSSPRPGCPPGTHHRSSSHRSPKHPGKPAEMGCHPRMAQGTGPVGPAWRPSHGRSWLCCSSRLPCPCGSHGLTQRSRTRRSTCGLGIWNGPGGCTMRRSRTSRPTSRAHQSCIRLWAPWPTVSAALPLHACCPWASCSAPRPSCGPRPPGCTGSEQHCWLRHCSPLSLARSSSARSPRMTRWRCSCSRWPRG